MSPVEVVPMGGQRLESTRYQPPGRPVSVYPRWLELTRSGHFQLLCPMDKTSAQTWNVIGWTAVALVFVSVLFAMLDPVMGIFVLWAAILVGGFSGIGGNATARFGIATIIAGLALGLIGTHYSTSTGLQPPELRRVLGAFTVVGLPILVSAAMLLRGKKTRRQQEIPGSCS